MKALSLLLVLAACASPLPEGTSEAQTVTETPPAPLPLGPGDVLQVLVHGQPEFSPEAGVRVTPAGSLVLPIAGPVAVGGLTVEEAGEAIEAALSEFLIEPRVGLTVQEHGAHHYHVLGEVGQAGTFVMDRPVTALDALASAGGVVAGARRLHVSVIRRHAEGEVEVHFFDASRPDSNGLVFLTPGDVVFVARSGFGVFRDEVLPVLQGIGFTTTQIATLAVLEDEL